MFTFFPGFASAQSSYSVAELQAKIQAATTQALNSIEQYRGILPNSFLDSLRGGVNATVAKKVSTPACPVRAVSAANPVSFTRDLQMGDSGLDVTLLQMVLNLDEKTAIATTGPESLGKETNYFSALTKTAVIKFQEKYFAEILGPSRLSAGTGYVGTMTRNKLTALYKNSNITVLGASTLKYTRNLSQGMSGSDVLAMQKLLNTDPSTQIQYPDSYGYESGVFGATTKDAVTRFQLKYFSEILSPGGLSAGTGYVGTLTRAVMNRLQSEIDAKSAPPTPKITSISPSSGKIGDVVTITGSDFTPTANDICGGRYLFGDLVSSADGITLTATIKDNDYTGSVPLFVQNEKGKSNNVNFKYEVVDIGGTPVISGLSPSSGTAGTVVTINGSGFAKTATNSIFQQGIGFGGGVASPDGTTLTFTVNGFYDFNGMVGGNKDGSFPYMIMVKNNNTNEVSNRVNFTQKAR